MGSPHGCIRESIVVIFGVKASATLQVTRDGGSSAYKIFMDKADGEGGRIFVYCYCWDDLLGIRRI